MQLLFLFVAFVSYVTACQELSSAPFWIHQSLPVDFGSPSTDFWWSQSTSSLPGWEVRLQSTCQRPASYEDAGRVSDAPRCNVWRWRSRPVVAASRHGCHCMYLAVDDSVPWPRVAARSRGRQRRHCTDRLSDVDLHSDCDHCDVLFSHRATVTSLCNCTFRQTPPSQYLQFAHSQFLPRDAMLARYKFMLSSCVRVCVSVSLCPPHAVIVSERLNIGSCKQRHTIGKGLSCQMSTILTKFERCHSQRGRQMPNAGGLQVG